MNFRLSLDVTLGDNLLFGHKHTHARFHVYFFYFHEIHRFPGFWTSQPNVVHYNLRASPSVVSELRQVLLNALLSVEGLIIIRLPPNLLAELVNIMAELRFNTHPRKYALSITSS